MTDVATAYEVTEPELITVAASVEQGSEHPLAKAVLQRAKGMALPTASSFEAVTGQGVKAQVEGSKILMGNLSLIEDQKIAMDEMKARAEELGNEGKTVIYIARDGSVVGLIAVADASIPTSRETIQRLKAFGIESVMHTGDNWATAKRITADLGIEKVFAEVRPDQKVGKVKEIQQEGKLVAMVGDGVNDAPALVQADVGIAIGAGTDVALESADVVLMHSDPLDVIKVIAISKATRRKMIENLWYAAGYNLIAFPNAGGVLYHSIGLLLRPEIAALTMAGSTLLVTINALLLNRTKLDQEFLFLRKNSL